MTEPGFGTLPLSPHLLWQIETKRIKMYSSNIIFIADFHSFNLQVLKFLTLEICNIKIKLTIGNPAFDQSNDKPNFHSFWLVSCSTNWDSHWMISLLKVCSEVYGSSLWLLEVTILADLILDIHVRQHKHKGSKNREGNQNLLGQTRASYKVPASYFLRRLKHTQTNMDTMALSIPSFEW